MAVTTKHIRLTLSALACGAVALTLSGCTRLEQRLDERGAEPGVSATSGTMFTRPTHDETDPASSWMYAQTLVDEHRLADARVIFEQITTDVPAFGKAWSAQGLCASVLGDDAGASRAWAQAARLILRNMAPDLETDGSGALGAAFDRRTSTIDELLASSHRVYGWTLMQAGRQDEAETQLRCAIAIAPADANGYWRLAWQRWYGARRAPEARELFLRSLELDPSNAEARSTYAMFLAICRQPDVAVKEFERAITDEPDNEYVLRAYAAFLKNKGDAGRARMFEALAASADIDDDDRSNADR